MVVVVVTLGTEIAEIGTWEVSLQYTNTPFKILSITAYLYTNVYPQILLRILVHTLQYALYIQPIPTPPHSLTFSHTLCIHRRYGT